MRDTSVQRRFWGVRRLVNHGPMADTDHLLSAAAPLSPEAPHPAYDSHIQPDAWALHAEFDPEAPRDAEGGGENVAVDGDGAGDDDAQARAVRSAHVSEPEEYDELDDPSIPDGLLAFGFCRSCHDSTWKVRRVCCCVCV